MITLQLILSYLMNMLQYLNTNLVVPMQLIQNLLSIKIDSLPSFLQTPVNFISTLMFLFIIIIGYANDFICNIVGLIYPLMCGFYIFNEKTVDTEKTIILTKYWMLFGSIMLMDTLFGFILNCIPGYHYLKMTLIYFLIRKDFVLTNTVFSLIMHYYNKSNIYSKIDAVLTFIMAKLKINKQESKRTIIDKQVGNKIAIDKVSKECQTTCDNA